MKITTVVTWRKDQYAESVQTLNGPVPNVVLGQIFVLDHPQMTHLRSGRVANIQHAVDLDHSVTTYIDVE